MNYLRNCWYVAGYAAEASQKPFARTYLEEPVVIYRTDVGRLVAMDSRCGHRFAPLDQGKVVGDAIQCPYHGLRFDPTGRCVALPDGGVPPPHTQRKTYPIVERHALLWMWMGDAAKADPASIPDFSYLEDPKYGWFSGYLHVKGHYQLMVDNLLDLSHSEFLHPLLASDGWTARNQQTITREGDALSIYNIAENDNILPLNKHLKPHMPTIGTTIQQERWDAPALVRLSVEFYAGGDELITPSGHFLTPETSTTTHYIVRGGQNIQPDNAEYTAGVRESVLNVFRTQDIPMIEAQQRVIGEGRDLMDLRPAILKGDRAGAQARHLLLNKIKEEQETASASRITAVSAAN